jgi:hypothetical protein
MIKLTEDNDCTVLECKQRPNSCGSETQTRD